jgi:ribonucleoside-diphosphate reductase alpha chain
MMVTLEWLKSVGEAPEWCTDESYKILCGGYLLEDETPKQMYQRISYASAKRLNKPELGEQFFDLFWNNWLGPASPVCSNMGTDRGLPISCFGVCVPDSVNGIMSSMHELGMMSKYGGGVALHYNKVRGRGAKIKGNGYSDGVVPFIKIQDSTTVGISQGGTRRGASAGYLDLDQTDTPEFLKIRKPQGDPNRQCLNIHQAVCITDEFMNKVKEGDLESRKLWLEILKTRFETGEPYIFFSDNVNNQNPESYKNLGLKVMGSNICCLGGDTLVTVKDGGLQKINELANKQVKIWDGGNWIVTNTFSQRGEDELYRVTISDGSYIDCNLNHRWFIARNYEDIRNGDYDEVKTFELKTGQWIENHYEQTHGNIEFNGAYLKGFLIGDGTEGDNKPYLRLHFPKYCCIDKLLSSTNEILPRNKHRSDAIIKPSFSEEKNYTDKYNGVYGTQKLRELQGLIVRDYDLIPWVTDNKKSLPADYSRWSKKTKLEFLSGLLDADGTTGKNGLIQISSVHESFIRDLQFLLKTLGYSGSIDLCKKETLDSYRITIGSFDANQLLKELSCQRIKFKGKIPNRKLTGWRKIVSITKLEGIYPVYCPTLPTTGKFGLGNGLMTGNTEIALTTDEEHSFVCCLSSMNLSTWEQWKDTNAVQLATWFLDGVMEEFIAKADTIPGFERSVRFAKKARALGLGVMGFHTLLQEKQLPFDCFDSFRLNNQIFRHIDIETQKATQDLAKEYGEPEWCKGLGIRNTHRIALAPTVTNAIISGNVSPSVEPWTANAFARKTAKGTFIHRNKTLEKLLESREQNTEQVWNSVVAKEGSVQHLTCLTKEEKEVFLTAREINQFVIVKLAGQRQQYIDQAQSINLFFPSNVNPKYFHEVHMLAWEQQLKTLYYCRTGSVLKGEAGTKEYKREAEECKACEG